MISKNDFDSEISKMIKYQYVFKVHLTLYFKVHFNLILVLSQNGMNNFFKPYRQITDFFF